MGPYWFSHPIHRTVRKIEGLERRHREHVQMVLETVVPGAHRL